MAEDQAIRAFLAIDPPKSVLEEIARIQERLKKKVEGMIRWTPPSGIHLTLKFFGDIASADIAPISATVEKGIVGIGPLPLEVKTFGVFPDMRRPRVIWLGTAGETGRLTALQSNLDEEFGKLGFPKEDRPFRAHWTLGRIKSPGRLTGLPRVLETGTDITAGAFNAEALILFKSELTQHGAVYTKLAEYALKE